MEESDDQQSNELIFHKEMLSYSLIALNLERKMFIVQYFSCW